MLTHDQHDEFMERGFLRLKEAFSRQAAADMVASFWSYVERTQNMRREDPATWTEGLVYGIADLKHDPVFQQIGSPTTVGVLDALMGKNDWQQPATWGQILATFPASQWSWNSLYQGRVEVDTVHWHTDYEYDTPPGHLVGVQVFAILADLKSGGGATLVIEGSPRLVQKFVRDQPPQGLKKMKRARRALISSHPWLQSISKPISLGRPEDWLAEQRTVIDGLSLALTELTGRAGDVYLCHPWLLHSSSPNCNQTPRLMCTQRIRRRVNSSQSPQSAT